MIEYKTGDILTQDAEALVNTVNCVGVMGRGIALQFKNAFPDNFSAYEKACRRGEVRPGHMLVFETGRLTNPRYIINFPTKRHWRGRSRLSDIESGLAALIGEVRARGIQSIAIPPLGSGLGGLHWPDVRSRIEEAANGLTDVRVVVFEPAASPRDGRAVVSCEAPNMTPGRAALVGLVSRYLSGLMDPFVTLLEIHKLLYFMQEAGEPLQLRYAKAVYGPYAENLRHVLRAIDGHYITGYADGGDAPAKRIELVPGAVQDADAVLASNADTSARFDRVADLVQGFETPFGLELLATVHWIATRDNLVALEDIVEQTYAWNSRKRRFSASQIELARDILIQKNWIVVTGDAGSAAT